MKRFLVFLSAGVLLSFSLPGGVSASNVNNFSNMTNTQDCTEKVQEKSGSNGFLFLGRKGDEQKDSKKQEENNEDSKKKTSLSKICFLRIA